MLKIYTDPDSPISANIFFSGSGNNTFNTRDSLHFGEDKHFIHIGFEMTERKWLQKINISFESSENVPTAFLDGRQGKDVVDYEPASKQDPNLLNLKADLIIDGDSAILFFSDDDENIISKVTIPAPLSSTAWGQKSKISFLLTESDKLIGIKLFGIQYILREEDRKPIKEFGVSHAYADTVEQIPIEMIVSYNNNIQYTYSSEHPGGLASP